MAPDQDNSNIIDKKETKIMKCIVLTMLYHARLVDQTMLRSIHEI